MSRVGPLDIDLEPEWEDVTEELGSAPPPYTLTRPGSGAGVFQFSPALYAGGALPNATLDHLQRLCADFGERKKLGTATSPASYEDPLRLWYGMTFAVRQSFIRVWYASDRKSFVLATFIPTGNGATEGECARAIAECERMASSILFAEVPAKVDYYRRDPERVEALRKASEPLVRDLRAAGFAVKSIDDVPKLVTRAPAVVPILIQGLHDTSSPLLKNEIVGCLRDFPMTPESVRALIAEFEKLDGPDKFDKWTLGDVIREKATDELFEDVARIAKDVRLGRARQMVILALGKMRDPRASDVLLGLLNDEEYGHAVSALGTLATPRAAPQLKRFVKDPREWIRKEAIAGLKRIARQS